MKLFGCFILPETRHKWPCLVAHHECCSCQGKLPGRWPNVTPLFKALFLAQFQNNIKKGYGFVPQMSKRM